MSAHVSSCQLMSAHVSSCQFMSVTVSSARAFRLKAFSVLFYFYHLSQRKLFSKKPSIIFWSEHNHVMCLSRFFVERIDFFLSNFFSQIGTRSFSSVEMIEEPSSQEEPCTNILGLEVKKDFCKHSPEPEPQIIGTSYIDCSIPKKEQSQISRTTWQKMMKICQNIRQGNRQPEKRNEYQTLVLNDRPFSNALAVSFFGGHCVRLRYSVFNFHCSIEKRCGKLGR